MVFIRLFFALGLNAFAVVASAIVSTRYGDVEGFIYRMKNGEDADVFLGIPYASPPTGALRFERPVPVRPWSEMMKTVDYGAACFPPYKRAMFPNVTYDEMCLYLNIMAPSKKSDSLLGYPVVVFIHGGGFLFYPSQFFGYQTLCDNFVSEGVVFVTLNCRVGFLGYLTTGDDAMPGNAALWDQTEALVFISENIAAFGGDPRRITLMGQSAGAASVSALSISPRSNVYFQQTVTFSGSVFCELSISDDVVADNLVLAKAVGCSERNTMAMKNCMKEVDIDKIMDAVEKIGPTAHSKDWIKFRPRFDSHFFPRPPEELMKDAPRLRNLVGVTDSEAALLVLDDEEKYRTGVAKSKSRGETFSAEDLSNFIRTVVATKKQFGEQAVQFQRQLVEFFVERDAPKNADQSFYLNRLIDLVSDVIFNLGIYHEVQLKLAKNWTTYFFVQEYHNYQLHAHRPYEGAYHCNEFPYLYGFSVMGDFEFNTDDYMFKKNLLHSLIRFIKTGEPADEDLNWPPVERNYPSRYLSMTPKPKMKAEYKPQNIHFWTKVVSEEIIRRLLSGMQITRSAHNAEHTEL